MRLREWVISLATLGWCLVRYLARNRFLVVPFSGCIRICILDICVCVFAVASLLSSFLIVMEVGYSEEDTRSNYEAKGEMRSL